IEKRRQWWPDEADRTKVRIAAEEDVEGIVNACVSVVDHVMKVEDEVGRHRYIGDERQHPDDRTLVGDAQGDGAFTVQRPATQPREYQLCCGHLSAASSRRGRAPSSPRRSACSLLEYPP